MLRVFFFYFRKLVMKMLKPCAYCRQGLVLVNGKTSDYGIAIRFLTHSDLPQLYAYGYNPRGDGNTLSVNINYCPMCGRDFTKKKGN